MFIEFKSILSVIKAFLRMDGVVDLVAQGRIVKRMRLRTRVVVVLDALGRLLLEPFVVKLVQSCLKHSKHAAKLNPLEHFRTRYDNHYMLDHLSNIRPIFCEKRTIKKQ